jgi:hypothetical protein
MLLELHFASRSLRSLGLCGVIGGGLALAACGGSSKLSESMTSKPMAVSGDVIREWDVAVHEAANVDDGYFGRLFFHDRAFAMVSLAQHDALNSINPRYKSYAYDGRNEDGDPVAAAAQAGHDVLAAAYPKQVASFDARLAAALSKIPEGDKKAKGIGAGQAAAAAVIAKRAGDGIDVVGEYKPTKVPGSWQFTPPFDGVAFQPGLVQTRPFALASADQFKPAPPPPFTGEVFTADFNEVKTIGAKDSTTRTADQSYYGQFWYEFSGAGWGRVARVVSAAKNSDAWDTARALALVHIATFDGYIAGFEAKYRHAPTAGIRPYTAIRHAESLGNPKLKTDPKWEPFLGTPPVPDYPSTHSVLGAAAAVVLASIYGDETAFTFTSPSTVPPNGSRSFKSFSEAAKENAVSRVIIGIHFRFATTAGLEQGKKVGNFVAASMLKPRGVQ